jgi:hypothetical protein
MLASAKGYALIVIACLAVSGGKQAHAETEEVLALKAYADFKMGLYNSAFTQFEYLASLGNTQGLLNLAIMLDEGLGCEPDHERATELLNQAADLGHVNAMERLASRFRSGAMVPKDQQKSIALYERAAEAGSVDAMYQLFVMYSDNNIDKSNHWLKLAKHHRHPKALMIGAIPANSAMPIEQELIIRNALDSIDRSANNRFVEGVIYFFSTQAEISVETRGLTTELTKAQLGDLWEFSFHRGPVYRLDRKQLSIHPINDTQAQIQSLLLETFDSAGTESLKIHEVLTVSVKHGVFQIDRATLQIE